jgi:hypothetical protein
MYAMLLHNNIPFLKAKGIEETVRGKPNPVPLYFNQYAPNLSLVGGVTP